MKKTENQNVSDLSCFTSKKIPFIEMVEEENF